MQPDSRTHTGSSAQPCGQNPHNRPLVHRKMARHPVVPVAGTPGAGCGAHALQQRKWLWHKTKRRLPTEKGNTYYNYYVFIENLKNNKGIAQAALAEQDPPHPKAVNNVFQKQDSGPIPVFHRTAGPSCRRWTRFPDKKMRTCSAEGIRKGTLLPRCRYKLWTTCQRQWPGPAVSSPGPVAHAKRNKPGRSASASQCPAAACPGTRVQLAPTWQGGGCVVARKASGALCCGLRGVVQQHVPRPKAATGPPVAPPQRTLCAKSMGLLRPCTGQGALQAPKLLVLTLLR